MKVLMWNAAGKSLGYEQGKNSSSSQDSDKFSESEDVEWDL